MSDTGNRASHDVDLTDLGDRLSRATDAAEIDALVRMMEPELKRVRRGVGYTMGLQPGDLDAFMEEAATICWEKREYYKVDRGHYLAWWKRICHNDAVSHQRKRKPTVLESEIIETLDTSGSDDDAWIVSHDMAAPFSPADVQSIQAWPLKVRIILLCLAGLWQKVPEALWRTWVEEFGLASDFPPPEYSGADDCKVRRRKLCEFIDITSANLNQVWCRGKKRLLSLEFFRGIDIRGGRST